MWKKVTIWMLVLAMLAALAGCGSTETAANTENAGSAAGTQQQAARKRLRKSLNLTGEDTSLLEFLSKY